MQKWLVKWTLKFEDSSFIISTAILASQLSYWPTISSKPWKVIHYKTKKHFAVLRFRVRTKSCFHLYFLVLFATTTNSWTSLNFWWTNKFEKGLKFRANCRTTFCRSNLITMFITNLTLLWLVWSKFTSILRKTVVSPILCGSLYKITHCISAWQGNTRWNLQLRAGFQDITRRRR